MAGLRQLKSDVLAELKTESSIKVTDIGVLEGRTLTLNGFATSFGEKWSAVNAAKRLAGANAFLMTFKSISRIRGYAPTAILPRRRHIKSNGQLRFHICRLGQWMAEPIGVSNHT
jgi:hypothetical protein